jgi:hypothetical protein
VVRQLRRSLSNRLDFSLLFDFIHWPRKDGLNECGRKTEFDNVSFLRAKLTGFGHSSFSVYDEKRNTEFPWPVISPPRGSPYVIPFFFSICVPRVDHAIDITYDRNKAITKEKKRTFNRPSPLRVVLILRQCRDISNSRFAFSSSPVYVLRPINSSTMTKMQYCFYASNANYLSMLGKNPEPIYPPPFPLDETKDTNSSTFR